MVVAKRILGRILMSPVPVLLNKSYKRIGKGELRSLGVPP